VINSHITTQMEDPHSLRLSHYIDASARTSTTRVDIMDTDNVPPADEVEQLPLEDPPTPAVPQTPQTALTFLLVSGRRRTMAFDPATTVGRVKELVWNAWPSGPSPLLFALPVLIEAM
jgi:hypothetical protein